MSNLIPTPRADKNGKIVIRHVKADDSDQKSAIIPAPAPMQSVPSKRDTSMDEVRYDLTDAIMEETADDDEGYTLDEDGNDLDEDALRGSVYEKLLKLPSLLLLDIDEVQQNNPKKFRPLAKLIQNGEKEIFLSNYLAFSDLADPEWDGMDVALPRSVTFYPQLKQYNYDPRSSGPEAVEKVGALLKVAQQIQLMVDEGALKTSDIEALPHAYDFERTPVIRNPELVDYILSSPEKADDIIVVVRDRKVTDPEAIKTVLEHPERALSSGTL